MTAEYLVYNHYWNTSSGTSQMGESYATLAPGRRGDKRLKFSCVVDYALGTTAGTSYNNTIVGSGPDGATTMLQMSVQSVLADN